MGIEAPPNIMKAGERPARVRTGAKTATKTQERDYLEKFRRLAEHPELLVPQWLGGGANPFDRLQRKLEKVRRIQPSDRRLRWASRGKHLWNAYAATLLVAKGGKIPSFASLKFQGQDVKFVYRPGAKRESLIGVQHFDDPEARLLGYIPFARRRRIYLVSAADSFVAARPGTEVADDALKEAFSEAGLRVKDSETGSRCDHVEGDAFGYAFELKDLQWRAELCLDCLRKATRPVHAVLEPRVLGPHDKLPVARRPRGTLFRLAAGSDRAEFDRLQGEAHTKAESAADEKYASYTEVELAGWTRDDLVRRLGERPQGFLLVGDELWMGGYEAAAQRLGGTDLERRVLTAAFRKQVPKQRVPDAGLHKLLEPAWREHGAAILKEMADGMLREVELAGVQRLPPTEAIASLARLLAARERFKEILQFGDLHPQLDFVVNCIQVHRSGERSVLSGKLEAAAHEATTKVLALSLARALGEQANLEWRYSSHEKDAAAFLDPFVREVAEAPPPALAEKLGKLAEVLGVPAPSLRAG